MGAKSEPEDGAPSEPESRGEGESPEAIAAEDGDASDRAQLEVAEGSQSARAQQRDWQMPQLEVAEGSQSARAQQRDWQMPRLVPKEAARVVALSWVAIALVGVSAVSSLWPKTALAPMPSCADGAYRSLDDGRVHCGLPPPGKEGVEALPARELLLVGTPLDLNSADAKDFELIPGIGAKLAERIVEDRRARGRFERIEDVERVKGIGPKIGAIVRRYARVNLPSGRD